MRTLALFLMLLMIGNVGCPDTPTSGADASIQPDAATGYDAGTPDSETVTPDATGPNAPPELARIGDRIVGVGEQLVIVLQASDPNNDPLSFSVFGTLPEGARFDKTERRFEWTPTAAGSVVFLTFVVSDGQEFDRETVRVEVVTDATSNPPVFQPIGDQSVVAETPVSVQLVATDPDGQAVSYGFEGSVPGKPSLDKDSGLFEWTPSSKLVGETVRITFTASDGGLSSALEVDFIITDGSGTAETPQPPEFEPIPDQNASVGVALSLSLTATDPNTEDDLSFALVSGQPEGATLSGNAFSWTPDSGQGGTEWEVVFSVNDGTFTTFLTVRIVVASPSSGQSCDDDAAEPNGDVASAAPITIGSATYTLCDSPLVGLDIDYFLLNPTAGTTYDVTLTFDADEGDLELFLLDGAESVIASSETVTSTESVSWKAVDAAAVYVVVLGVGQPDFAMSYALELSEATTVACIDDAFEPNDISEDAKPLPPAAQELQICAGNRDFFIVDLMCGQSVTVTLDTQGSGDLDFGLYPPGSNTPVATGATESPVETGTVDVVDPSGTYTLRVEGFPAATEEGSYTVAIDTLGGCLPDDAGDSSQSALSLLGNSGSHDNFRLCCADDWFRIDVTEGVSLLVDVTVAEGSAGMSLSDASGTQLAASAPSPDGAILQHAPVDSGPLFVTVTGATNSQYTLQWLVEELPDQTTCTTQSCQKYSVCNDASGECVSDFCIEDADCPGGHICLETYCANPCTHDGDCRADYACKAFEQGLHCGIEGSTDPGGTCFSHTTCAGNAVCWFKSEGGYCAALGCLENADVVCPENTECTLDSEGHFLCGLSCQSDADCRLEDGFSCTPPEDTCLP